MAVLIAFFLVVLIAMAAFAIDVAYMHLVRTQLRAATDAAAKAGVQALTTTQSDQAGINAAIAMAAKNRVAGRPLRLTASDIDLGQSQLEPDGSWSFVAGATPTRAMRINSSMSSSNANGAVPLFLGGMLGRNYFTPSESSVASSYELEVVLVLDRSHSMCFDLSGSDWSYPSPIYRDVNAGIKSVPRANSRWKSLEKSVTTFATIVSQLNTPPRIAVVTWGSEIGRNTTEYALTGKTAQAVTRDQGLTTNFGLVVSAVTSLSGKVMLGGTNMSAGIDEGTGVLTGADVRPYAERIMILMTDGQWNQGRDPLDAASDALGSGITIHTIGFLSAGQSSTLIDIAELTGGKYYAASNEDALENAFRELALTLPVVITK